MQKNNRNSLSDLYIIIILIHNLYLRIIACGYPVSVCCLTASCTTLRSWGHREAAWALLSVRGLPTSWYGLTDRRIGPTFVWNKEKGVHSQIKCLLMTWLKYKIPHEIAKKNLRKTFSSINLPMVTGVMYHSSTSYLTKGATK